MSTPKTSPVAERMNGEERRYIRLAYSGISAELICEGLSRLKEWAQ
jgi:hypothetical protein